MFIDAQTQLWNATALTTSAYSTNSYDLGAVPSNGSANGEAVDPSAGEPLGMVISVGVAATHSGTETYQWEVTQSASSTASSSPDTLVTVAFTTAQSATLLAAGTVIVVPIPPGSVSKRYLSGHYTSANSASITITAWIAPLSMIQKQHYYTSAIVVN